MIIFAVNKVLKNPMQGISAALYLQHPDIQSTLVISKSKGPSNTVRNIRTSTYQICSIEEKTI